MYIKNVLIGLGAAFLSLLSFILIWPQSRSKPEPLGRWLEIKRALLIGLCFLIFFMSGFFAVYYLGSPGVEKHLSLVSIEGLFCCLAFPGGLFTFIGSFIWFRRRDAYLKYLSGRMDKIIEKSKK